MLYIFTLTQLQNHASNSPPNFIKDIIFLVHPFFVTNNTYVNYNGLQKTILKKEFQRYVVHLVSGHF